MALPKLSARQRCSVILRGASDIPDPRHFPLPWIFDRRYEGRGALFTRIDYGRAKILFEAATGRLRQVIGGDASLCSIGHALGNSRVELFERTRLCEDVVLSPAFEELDRCFGHWHARHQRLRVRPHLGGV